MLETHGTEMLRAGSEDVVLWLWGAVAGLSLTLLVFVVLCVAQRTKYLRKIRTAAANVFGNFSS